MSNESLLNWMPDPQSKKNYRLQCSLSLEEAAQLEQLLVNPLLPFAGDTSSLIRTFVRYGIMRLHEELHVADDSFVQSIKPMLGSELLRWSAGACDSFAVASTDHLALAIDAGDSHMAQDVLTQVADVVEEIKNPSAKAMIKRSLSKRGFLHAMGRLRQMLMDEGESVYALDTMEAETFV